MTDHDELDPAYREALTRMFEREIRFNAYLGLRIDELRAGEATIRIPFRQELVGDPLRPALHGGVISALLDTAGGLAAFTAVNPGDRLATVDLRVDYLRPARLEDVVAQARVIRVGNRVAVSDIVAFHDDPERPVASGKAVYNVKRRED